MLTRRRMLALTGSAVAVMGAMGVPSRSGALAEASSGSSAGSGGPATARTLRLSILQFGSAAWALAAMGALRLDEAHGLALGLRRAANNDAGRLAFLTGAVDGVVSDLLWAARLRAEGRGLVYLPFSTGSGAVMVPAGSKLRTLADLDGARLGVAGGPLDKSWLLLQAHARAAGIDLTKKARLAFGAPPLLAAQLEQGGLDAALLYWTFCARLEPKGYTPLITVNDILAAFGIAPPPALVGYVFDGGFAEREPAILAAFTQALAGTQAALGGAGSDAATGWSAARQVMQAEDDATFEALKRGYIAGIPGTDAAADRAAAGKLVEVLAAVGGEAVLGPVRTLPEGFYWQPAGGAR